jgi:7-cyano-7-deazaguanine synthase
MPSRAVVLVSGGLDSTTCLAVAREAGHELFALSFDYGQRHRFELEAARKQAELARVSRHVVVSLNLRDFGGSALTADIAVPKAGTVASAAGVSGEIPVTYVPARNTIFLSIALGWAEVLRADAIYIGVNALDYSGYPDCRPEFIEAFRRMAALATKGGVEGSFAPRIETPLISLTKADIVRLAARLGVDFAATWSCYDPVISNDNPTHARPCGACESCVLRARGFAEAGIRDPLV